MDYTKPWRVGGSRLFASEQSSQARYATPHPQGVFFEGVEKEKNFQIWEEKILVLQ